tara:strand:- start:2535 stop:2843 length:309 start_codon:yes stop_codon:yes gene_type:complete
MGGCRTSFVQSASKMIAVGQCRLVSIHSVLTGSNPTTIKVYDTATSGAASAGNEMARIILRASPASPSMIEFDMHGVIANNGLYLEISAGTGEGAAVSVEFS